MIENILINGLIHGGVYALLAVGFSLIFGVARIVNIAHTAFYMIAAYLIYTFATRFGLNPLLAISLSIIIVPLIGILVYQLTIKPIQEHEVTVLIVTIALAMVFQEVMLLIFGGHFRGNPSLFTGYLEIIRRPGKLSTSAHSCRGLFRSSSDLVDLAEDPIRDCHSRNSSGSGSG